MLHSCNVLNVFDSGSTDKEECTRVNRTGGQQRDASKNQMPFVCNDATTRKSTLSQESQLSTVAPMPSE